MENDEIKKEQKIEDERRSSLPLVLGGIVLGLILLGIGILIGASANRGNFRNRDIVERGSYYNGFGGHMRGNMMRGNNGYNNRVIGQITTINDKVLTIKDSDNVDHIITVSDSTSIINFDGSIGKFSDLKVNNSVAVSGKSDINGNFIANTIQIR